MERRIAVVGSTSFPITPEIGAEVVDVLREFPQGTTFLTRGSPGFDHFIRRVGEVAGLSVVVYPARGGSSNWDRDVALVRDATEVLAFLDPATLSDSNTGTAHIVEKALDQRKPTRAWTVADNHLVFAGSNP